MRSILSRLGVHPGAVGLSALGFVALIAAFVVAACNGGGGASGGIPGY